MQNKKFLVYIFLLITSLTQSQIVTSKKEAVKKGIYEKPFESKSVATNPNTGILKTTKKSALTKPAKAKKTVINDSSDEDLVVGPTENYLASQMINNAMEFIGVNYRGGGTSKSGMDCSGMVTAVFDIFGLKLPRSSHDMAKVGEKLKQGEIKKGDLVFFRTNGRSTINHVGLVVEANDDEIKFIHSSTQKGVIISSTKEPYYKRTFAQANRVLM
jgi:lipoprotein Spr